MPVFYGLFVQADGSDIERMTFPEDAEWTFTVQKKGQRDDVVCPVRASITASRDCEGRVEWNDIRGIDRAVCDRSEREGSVKLLKEFRRGSKAASQRKVRSKRQPQHTVTAEQLGELCPGSAEAPLLVLSCQGCEPVEWQETSSALLEDTDGSMSEESDIAFDGGFWMDRRGRSVSGLRYEFRRL